MVGPPLAGLRVLDLTRFVAGSQATMLLVTMGAEVEGRGPARDPYRWQERNGSTGSPRCSSRRTRVNATGPRLPQVRAAKPWRILASADMLVETSRPGSLSSPAPDWPSGHARYPSLIYGSISGYGDVGPDAARGGFDLILQAASGMMSVTATPSSGQAKVGAPVLDVGVGLTCALAIDAVERQRTGVSRRHRRCSSSPSPARARWPRVCWPAIRRACWGPTRPCSRRTAVSEPLTAGWCWPPRARKTCGAARARYSGGTIW